MHTLKSLNIIYYIIFNIFLFKKLLFKFFLEQKRQRSPFSYELFARTHQANTSEGLRWTNDKVEAISVSFDIYVYII